MEWSSNVAPLKCSWLNDSSEKPTFPFLADGALAMSDEVYHQCEEIFAHACEFFFLEVEGESWVALNVIDICNGLDKARSKIVDDGSRIDHYAIIGSRTNENVFKIPETADHEVFTSVGDRQDSDQEFFRFYVENRWSGLDFKEV